MRRQRTRARRRRCTQCEGKGFLPIVEGLGAVSWALWRETQRAYHAVQPCPCKGGS